MDESRGNGLLGDGRLMLAITAAAAFLTFLGPLAAYDLWWHLKAGSLIIQDAQVPHTDIFSYTATGRPWTFHSWLAAVALWGLWKGAGATGVVLFRALMMTASVVLAWALARRRGVGAAMAAVFALVAALQLRQAALARPLLFSFVLFGVFALMLQSAAVAEPPQGEVRRAHRPRRAAYWLWGRGGRLALMAPLMLLWANLHAGFMVGFLLLGAYGVGEMVRLAVVRGGRPYLRLLVADAEGARFRAMLIAGVAALAASMATPFGAGALTYTVRVLGGIHLIGKIQEWRPTPRSGDYAIFWALLVLGTALIARSWWSAARGGRLRQQAGRLFTDTLLFAGFGLMAVRGERNVAWVMLLAPALMGSRFGLSAAHAGAAPGRRMIYGVAAIVLALAVGLTPFLHGRGRLSGIDEDHIPVQACDFIDAHGLAYRTFNSYEWGGYVIYRLWPMLHVFCDGRTDLYGDDVLGRYLRVAWGASGWRDVLAGYDVQMLLIDYRLNASRHFFEDRQWRCVYWDDAALVALRADCFNPVLKLDEMRYSNPAVFEESLKTAPPQDILDELDAVLRRQPDCWTALAERARALVRMAAEQPERSEDLLAQAGRAADAALQLQSEQPAPYLAQADLARALGDGKLAAKAEAEARKYAKNKR
jgi:hypothetical protein